MRDERRNEGELLRYVNALRHRVVQPRRAGPKEATEDVRESEQIFRAIFDNAADGILLTDVESKRFYMGNRVICQMLGYGEHELKTLEVVDIHPEEDLPYVIEQYKRQMEGELTLARNIPVKRKDGSTLYADINAFPMTLGPKTYLVGIFRDITSRKHLEQKTAMLARFPDEDPNPVLRISEDCTILYANKASSPVLETWQSQVGHSLPEACCERARATLNSGRVSTFEFKCDDGRLFLVTLAPVVGEGYLNAYGVDITDRKKAEEALERSEKNWYSLLRNAPDAILNLDREGTILFINHTVPGYTTENTVGRTVYDFLPPGEHAKTREAINKVFETGRPVKFETSVMGPDGRLLWYLTHLGPIKDGDTVASVAQVSTDITESKRTQAMLQTKNAAIASSINGIAIGDMEGNLTYVNKSFLEMWGYRDENEVLGKNAVAFWQEQDQALEVIEALRDKGGWIGELTAVRKDGSARDIQVCATSVTDENNRPISMMASFVDVTDPKNREKELATCREHMGRAEQLASLGTLSATIAHQVTQPLTVIRLSLDNVLDELEGISCSRTALRRLRDSVAQVSHITAIVNRFRSFARQSSDTASGEVCVYAVATRVARLLGESARQAKVTLHVEDMRDFPSVFLSERELEQIFFALIENAIQAADGKKARQVVIGGSAKDEQIELTFSDNCGGVAPENLEKVFEPFFTTKPRGEGTGLGLCVVQDAVARVGGHVRLESELGKGSTFFVVLPINED